MGHSSIMGITVFKDSSDSTRTYLRITRAINGKEQQRYVRVEGTSKAAMKRAMKEAKEIDQRLEQWQTAVKQLIALSGDNLIHEDGTIVGLQLQTRFRDGRRPATEFKIRVKLNDQPPLFKSVSVDKYGFDEAFQISVNRICEMRNLSEESEAFDKLMAAKEAYLEKHKESEPSDKMRLVSSRRKDQEDGLFDQLKGIFRKKAG